LLAALVATELIELRGMRVDTSPPRGPLRRIGGIRILVY
jgi:hypothetical protein